MFSIGMQVVGEALAKLVQLYAAQLIDHKRWDDTFEDQGRVETAKRVMQDAELLAKRFGGLMGDSRKWRQIERYVITPLRDVGSLMAAAPDDWLQKAAAAADLYDAGRAARQSPQWVPDEGRVACALCREDFGVFRRRHHCRYCGWVVCDACRRPLQIDRWLRTEHPHGVKVAASGRKEKEVCLSCYEHAPDEMDDTTGWRGSAVLAQVVSSN
eukprot:COSAG01_NODE_563_length_15451_cov_70.726225_4_plen_213_part_00